MLSKKSKHFATKVEFVKQMISMKNVDVRKIDSHKNLADLGTKALPRESFQRHVYNLFDNNSIQSVTHLRGSVGANQINHLRNTRDTVRDERDVTHDETIHREQETQRIRNKSSGQERVSEDQEHS